MKGWRYKQPWLNGCASANPDSAMHYMKFNFNSLLFVLWLNLWSLYDIPCGGICWVVLTAFFLWTSHCNCGFCLCVSLYTKYDSFADAVEKSILNPVLCLCVISLHVGSTLFVCDFITFMHLLGSIQNEGIPSKYK